MFSRNLALAGCGLYSSTRLTKRTVPPGACFTYGRDEDAFPEPALLRRLRRWRRLAISGDPRGVVVLVSDLARLPGGNDSRRAAARRAAAQLHRRDDDQRGEELRPGRDSYLDPVAQDGHAHGGSNQGRESERDHRDGRGASDRAARGAAASLAVARYRGAQGIRLLDA